MKRSLQIISITSGKGGAGKTSILANLAVHLAQKGKRVLILDGDLGMANIDIYFAVRSDVSIYDVIIGKKQMQDILVEVSTGVFLLPGGSGIIGYNNLNAFQRWAILNQLSELPQNFDYVLIDTAPGISENVLYLNAAADEICVVVTPDPASITDAYALIKVLNKNYKKTRFNILCNMVRDSRDGLALYERFNDVATRFLHVGLDYFGSIPLDPTYRKLNMSQRLIMKHERTSPSALGLIDIANSIQSKSSCGTREYLQPFWEQVVGVA